MNQPARRNEPMNNQAFYTGPIKVFPPKYVVAGTRDEFVIGFMAPKYPERFQSEDEAKKRATEVGRPYYKEVVSVYRRITP